MAVITVAINFMSHWKHKLFGLALIVLVALGVELGSRVVLPSYFTTARRILLGAEETPPIYPPGMGHE